MVGNKSLAKHISKNSTTKRLVIITKAVLVFSLEEVNPKQNSKRKMLANTKNLPDSVGNK